MRFIGRREGVVARARRADGLGRGHDGRQRADHTVRCVQLRRQGGDRRRCAKLQRASSEEEFRARLYAPEMHDPDLLIRTSGEQRISNFLLWQCAYSEIVFSDELWPDFGRAEFEAALAEYEHPPAAFRGPVAMEGRARSTRSSTSTTRAATGPTPPPPLARGSAAAPAPDRRRRAARNRRSDRAPRRSPGSPGRCRGSRSWSRSRWSAASCLPPR